MGGDIAIFNGVVKAGLRRGQTEGVSLQVYEDRRSNRVKALTCHVEEQ